MQQLDPVSFPLEGIRLIEASAGTGKTYTIASLFLRSLLEQQLRVDQILLVTFTRAASEELHSRIRRRIREAIQIFQRGSHTDPLYRHLLAHLDPEQAITQLQDALVQMDEAAIFTIHGFCQRALQENAFESGELFEFDFVAEISPLLRQSLQDFWRRQFYTASRPLAQFASKTWGDPQNLLQDIQPYLQHTDFNLDLIEKELELAGFEQLFQETLSALRREWDVEKAGISELLFTHPGLDRRRYQTRHLRLWLGHLADYLADEQDLYAPPESLARFTPAQLQEAAKPGYTAPTHPAFALIARLRALARALPGLIRRDAILFCRRNLSIRKQDAGVLSYDDLLQRLDRALQHPQGKRLAARLRQQHPIAMIDEFQDTDAMQYRIFRTIYGETVPATGLFLIGDPKQAIYAFRGADIFTYIRASRDTAGSDRHFTLNTNWRSSRELVQAVNTLFSRAESPFVFNQDIPFHPVQAAAEADDAPLRIDGDPVSPLHCWFMPRMESNQRSRSFKNPFIRVKPQKWQAIRSDWAQSTAAEQTAEEIHRLLISSRTTLGERPLQADDIAVLVRDRHEARVVQEALGRWGLNSLFLSRDNVFQSEEALELGRLLLAIAYADSERYLRAALTTQLLGVSATQLNDLIQDDVAWEACLQQFSAYRKKWLQQGFLALFRTLLVDHGISQRLLQTADGERRITNLRHLAELIQCAATDHQSIELLTHWFCLQSLETASDEAQELRLESDSHLVKVVTQHKSKGMEYPIVFFPFPWRSRLGKLPPEHFLFHHEGSGEAFIELGSDRPQANRKQFMREQLAEDVRLLYVALTRSRHRCYITWGLTETAPHSAMAYLLHQTEPAKEQFLRVPNFMASLTDQEIWEELQQLTGGCNISLEQISLEGERGVGKRVEAEPPVLSALACRRRIYSVWRLNSFSSLTLGRLSENPKLDMELHTESISSNPEERIFSFPRGARAGTFMHALLEGIDFRETHPEILSQQVEEGLSRYGFEPRWQAVIEQMLQQVLHARLDHQTGLHLARIGIEDRLIEMEFHFPLAPVTGDAINRIVRQYSDRQRRPLNTERIQGMMKGYIDLVFRYQGQFFIVDYKSNHLGGCSADYHQQALRDAIAEHHYDLQYLIYTLALHRYLRMRIKGYEYDRHFGGVYYLFLRGMQASHDRGIYYHKPDLQCILALDALFSGTAME